MIDESTGRRFPDFFITGAMKSGTSTFYAILSQHPRICGSVPKEPHFLSRDDLDAQGRYYLWEFPRRWREHDWEKRESELLEEYSALFRPESEDQLLFEASTHYLESGKAARRIARINPRAKLIFMLRNPVDRAYSHYWHWVKRGRAIYRFEDQLKLETPAILEIGRYARHLRTYFELFDREQMAFVIFERLKKQPERELAGVLEFLGLELPEGEDALDLELTRNPSVVPRSLAAQLWFNRFQRLHMAKQLTANTIERERDHRNPLYFGIEKLWRKLNLTTRRYPPMRAETRELLAEYYRRENAGLSDLIGIELEEYW
ncbi:MAG: sulfotransferase [Polyangia bacterium]